MTSETRIPTNLRTLLLLEALGQHGAPMSATELGDAVGLSKQTAHRLCQTLESEGFLTRAGPSKKFQPARRARTIAAGLLNSSHMHIARHQVLEDVARRIGETVNFVVPEETGMRYLDRVETDWPFRVLLPVGSNVPFHCTASGKTFMASLPGPARRAFVAALTLDRHTDRTHVSGETLLGELETIARRGYALDDEEFIDEMVAIAVPVTDPQGHFVAALAFHGPTSRIKLDQATEHLSALTQGATRLQQVHFCGDPPEG